jgi:hypothetical protein
MEEGEEITYKPQGINGPKYTATVTKAHGPDMVDLHVAELDQDFLHINYFADDSNLPPNANHACPLESQ